MVTLSREGSSPAGRNALRFGAGRLEPGPEGAARKFHARVFGRKCASTGTSFCKKQRARTPGALRKEYCLSGRQQVSVGFERFRRCQARHILQLDDLCHAVDPARAVAVN